MSFLIKECVFYALTSRPIIYKPTEAFISNSPITIALNRNTIWMDSDPEIRLKYSDYFFSLSNVQELYSGEVECCARFDVVQKKAALEAELQEWIMASPERVERWGKLLQNLQETYAAVYEP